MRATGSVMVMLKVLLIKKVTLHTNEFADFVAGIRCSMSLPDHIVLWSGATLQLIVEFTQKTISKFKFKNL